MSYLYIDNPCLKEMSSFPGVAGAQDDEPRENAAEGSHGSCKAQFGNFVVPILMW
jgi:hypothetical protein